MLKLSSSIYGTLTLVLLAVVAMSSCFAYRTREKQVLGPGGSENFPTIKKTVKAETATRDAIQKQLRHLDTGVGSPAFFWGRWVRDSELQWVSIGPMGTGSWTSNARTDVQNLFAEFDNNGRVRRWEVFDEDDLAEKMIELLRRTGPTTGLSAPTPLSCVFQWRQLTRVKAHSHDSYSSIKLEFFITPDRKQAVCSVETSPKSAFAIFNHLVLTGQDSLLK